MRIPKKYARYRAAIRHFGLKCTTTKKLKLRCRLDKRKCSLDKMSHHSTEK